MTKTKLRELDAYIAEHVMGWRCESCKDGFKRKWPIADWNRIRELNPRWPKNEPDLKCDHAAHYTTDPAAAFEVLKKCAEECDKSGDGVFVAMATPIRVFEVGRMELGFEWCIECAESDQTLELAIAKFAKKLFAK